MTDTTLSTTAPDWRIFARQIRANLLGRLGNGTDFDQDGLVFGEPDNAPTGATSKARLTHRQSLLAVSLAATFGDGEALANALGRNGLIAITDMPRSISGDIAQMLSAALPEGRLVADTPYARRQPDAVIVLDTMRYLHGDKPLRSRLEGELNEALKYSAPLILLLPPGLAPEELLGSAQKTTFRMRPLDGEIIVEVLRHIYPGADVRGMRAALPDDDQLSRTPIFGFMLALRCNSAAAAVDLLAKGRWPTQLEDDETDDPHLSAAKPTLEGIRLADLTGLGAAQKIAVGIVEDLRAWDAEELAWRDVHRGLIVAGPPGCGKTELARAMAREPDIHLEATSYGDWQAAGHLGLMLAAMRKSFKAAAHNAPAVLFIDEIDAFGSRSGSQTSSNKSYDEKVIAALLEQLDGVGSREGVVVIGACNHLDRIDPALRRAGRFDAVVHIQRPDAAALATILRQHLGDDLADADLNALGQMIIGASGADCAAAVRSARAAARQAKRAFTETDLRAALVPDHLTLPQAMRRRAAIHEAGHAVAFTAMDLGQVKALRIGPGGGETVTRWREVDLTMAEIYRHCVGHLSGRAAELLILGDAGAGAGGDADSDLGRATQLLLAAELSFGLGDHGHLAITALPDPAQLLRLPPAIRDRLRRRLDRAVEDATQILQRHRGLLDSLAEDLEARGLIGEAELAQRLDPIRDVAARQTGAHTSGDPSPAVTSSGSDANLSAPTNVPTTGQTL